MKLKKNLEAAYAMETFFDEHHRNLDMRLFQLKFLNTVEVRFVHRVPVMYYSNWRFWAEVHRLV